MSSDSSLIFPALLRDPLGPRQFARRLSNKGTYHALRFVILPLALLVCTAGCGFGTAGVAAAIGKSGRRTTTSVTTLSGSLTVMAKTSPARIRFTLVDEQSDPATVDFFYTLPLASEEILMTALDGLPATLATSPTGIEYGKDGQIKWSFIDEQGIPRDGSLIKGVTIIARVRGGTSQGTTVDLGNDLPVVDNVVVPTTEIAGVVPVGFRVKDSSDDTVDVRVEFYQESNPAAGWRPARSAGTTFRSVVAPSSGVDLVFFWDTDSVRGDLRDLERIVRVRLVAEDSVGSGEPVESAMFRVDNNDAPIVQLGELSANPDDRRGIPIPYTVVDAEGDPVRVLFQWRRPNEARFPDLETTNPVALARLVKDPSFVRRMHICAPFPGYATGYARPVDTTHVRLPELQQGESRLLANGGMEFRSLELMRPTLIARLAPTWAPNPLARPTAALPLGDGITALVLDGLGNTSRLLEVDLATGAARTIAEALMGLPTALALDADEKRALVATDLGASWQLFGVDLAIGTHTPLIAGPTGSMGALRGILPMGDKAALATAANSLWRLDWSGTGTIVPLRGKLATPWGLALDPLRPGHVLIAERDAHRIVSFDVNTRAIEPVPAIGTAGPAFVRPTSIATVRTGAGTRLVALCDATPTQREIFGLNLGSQASTTFSLGLVPTDAATVALGAAELILVALPLSTDLAAGGGIEQRREVVAFDLADLADPATVAPLVTVATAFAPAVREAQAWRIAATRSLFDSIRGTPGGTPDAFVWDSRQAGLSVGALVRATAMDTEPGSSAQTSVAHAIKNVDKMPSDVGDRPDAVVAADLDGDGYLDLVCTNDTSRANLRVFFQDQPRTFTPGQPLDAGDFPQSLAAADLDGDGDLDLVCANAGTDSLTVFFQSPPRMFTERLTLKDAGDSPQSVAVADLDGDGAPDLVCANAGSNNLTVFFQSPQRTFDERVTLNDAGDSPRSVVVGDLNGDGALDLVCANAESDNLTVFFQSPRRMFDERMALNDSGDSPRSVAVGDLNGDGALDLVCANAGSNNLTVFFQSPQRMFDERLTLVAGDSPRSVATADLDGDGNLDLVCANRNGNNLTVFIQGMPGMFTSQPLKDDTREDGPTSVAVADLDGNGDLDIVCAYLNTRRLTAFFQEASRTFSAQAELVVAGSPQLVAAADLEGDGDLDLICANSDSNSLTVFFQGAPGAFTEGPTLVAEPLPKSLAVADLDGDGNLDLVCANLGRPRVNPGNLTVFFQDSLREFTAQPPRSAGDGPVSVAAADLDGDGDLDLVCANSRSNDLTVFFQDSLREFTACPPLPAGVEPSSVAAADLDGDGDLDLVCANTGTNNLTVFLQESPRKFKAQPPLPVGVGPSSVVAADLDGDGDLDLVCANAGFGSTSLTVLFQNPSHSFIERLTLDDAGDGPRSVVAADLDGDGDLDLVCAKRDNNLTVFFQDSPRAFRAETVPTGSSYRAVTAADLDGDGDSDLACANTNNGLTVFLGRSR